MLDNSVFNHFEVISLFEKLVTKTKQSPFLTKQQQQFISQFSHSVVSYSLRPRGRQASLSITHSWSLLKLMSIVSVMPSNHLFLFLFLPPSAFPSIRIFSNKLVLRIRWPRYWSFSFSISASNEHPKTDLP